MAPADKSFFPGIQVLRALAALLVVFGHAQHEALQISQRTGQVFSVVHYPFDLGVHIFFVISGFVIVLTSWKLPQGFVGAQFFWQRRFVRVVPLYWFYTSFMIVALFAFPHAIQTAAVDWGHFLKSYLFIPHIRPAGDVKPVLSLGWTLNYEMFFYVVFGFLLLLPRRLCLSALYGLFAILVIAGFWIPEDMIILHFWTRPIIFEFVIGAMIAHFACAGGSVTRMQLWVLVAAALGGIVCIQILKDTYSLYHPLNVMLKGMVGGALVALAVLPVWARALNVPKFILAIGDSSYSLYLAHPFVLGAMMLIWSKLWFLNGISLWVYVACVVVACLLGAYISYLLVEKPVLSLARRWLKNPEKSAS